MFIKKKTLNISLIKVFRISLMLYIRYTGLIMNELTGIKLYIIYIYFNLFFLEGNLIIVF